MNEKTDPLALLERDHRKDGRAERSCLGVTRRTVIKGFGATLAAIVVPQYSSAKDDRSRVAVVRMKDIESMTRKAIHLAGGLDEIKDGETVIIKPNLVTIGRRVTTHPEVLRAVIRAVKERTAAENIAVGDSSGFWMPTLAVAESNGVSQVCIDEGVGFLPFELGSFVNFIHPSFTYFETPIQIPEALSSFDHFINVPTCKTHSPATVGGLLAGGVARLLIPPGPPLPPDFLLFYARFTLCMKNFVGLMPFKPLDPGSHGRVDSLLHMPDIGEKIAELNLCVPGITMNVIDAVTALVNRGPGGGPDAVFTEPNLVIASKDRVACDSVGLALLKHEAKLAGISPADEPYIEESVWESPQIAHAGALGIGRAFPSDIKIINGGVGELNDILDEWV